MFRTPLQFFSTINIFSLVNKSMAESPQATPRIIKLTTVKGTTVDCKESPFFGKCRDVEDFEKLNRVGEGTYGVV